jgi:hypothetical protein
MRTLIILACLVPIVALAAALPPDPGGPIARKKELLFSDDFQKAQLDPRWHQVVETFTVENGALKGTQTRGGDKPHAAVFGLDLPTRDSVIEVKIRFEGNTMMDIEFDDRNFQGSHYGHLCCAQVRLDSVTIIDQRDGSQSNALIELRKDTGRNQAQIDRLLATHSAAFPANLEGGKWYTLVVETIGDAMRVTIDGRPAAFFNSPGIGHETKSKIEFGVAGRSGLYDDIKIWNAESASAPAVGTVSQP